MLAPIFVVFFALDALDPSLCETRKSYNNEEHTKIHLRPNLEQLELQWPWLQQPFCTNVELLSEAEAGFRGNPQHVQKNKKLRKRNPVNLHNMIECATKCRPWDLLGYGNYCGLGGSGRTVDSIDGCCKEHDDCYGEVIQNYDCWQHNVYLLPYNWSCQHGEAHCGHESNTCRRETCYCDKKLTECLNIVGCP